MEHVNEQNVTLSCYHLYGNRETVKSTKEFAEGLKQRKLPKEHKIISLEVKSFFPNVRLDRTIEIILKIIYEKNERVTSITKIK